MAQPFRPCSRQPTAGSIAVTADRCTAVSYPCTPAASGGLHCGNGYPAYEVWTMSSSPVVPWQVPLRLGEPRQRHPRTAHVFPPVTGGLHCGFINARSPDTQVEGVLPPVSGGLNCGCSVHPWRVFMFRGLPPTGGGLHCGEFWVIGTVIPWPWCSRRLRGGSIVAA